ncbi:head-tail adaptor protein [Clostridiaceae bacterium 14S0207]|nr:head-tail adaptor protein [Clostridiaceae bacterium 14S0207]
MDPGKLDKRIKFICKEPKKDSEGYPIPGDNVFKECWASVRGLRGREFYSAAAIQSETDKVFNCRYFKGLKANMKIEYNNNFYEITSINDLNEKHIEYEIHAKEVKISG